MSANKYQPHVYVIPEDDADRQIVNGFLNHIDIDQRRISVGPLAGGRDKAVEYYISDIQPTMAKFPERHVVIVVDFDEDISFRDAALQRIGGSYNSRIFIVGSFDEPEDLIPTLGSLETVGIKIANACATNDNSVWSDDLLKHNLESGEVARMQQALRPILFPNL